MDIRFGNKSLLRSSVAAAIAATLLALCPAVARAEPALANPKVRLWYSESGRLSDDIAGKPDFSLWNTIIGEGDAEENASDVLFTIEVRDEDERFVQAPLVLMAKSASGKILAERKFPDFLTGSTGSITAALWVPDVGCAGDVTFSATLGTSKQSTALSFACGE